MSGNIFRARALAMLAAISAKSSSANQTPPAASATTTTSNVIESTSHDSNPILQMEHHTLQFVQGNDDPTMTKDVTAVEPNDSGAPSSSCNDETVREVACKNVTCLATVETAQASHKPIAGHGNQLMKNPVDNTVDVDDVLKRY